MRIGMRISLSIYIKVTRKKKKTGITFSFPVNFNESCFTGLFIILLTYSCDFSAELYMFTLEAVFAIKSESNI